MKTTHEIKAYIATLERNIENFNERKSVGEIRFEIAERIIAEYEAQIEALKWTIGEE